MKRKAIKQHKQLREDPQFRQKVVNKSKKRRLDEIREAEQFDLIKGK